MSVFIYESLSYRLVFLNGFENKLAFTSYLYSPNSFPFKFIGNTLSPLQPYLINYDIKGFIGRFSK